MLPRFRGAEQSSSSVSRRPGERRGWCLFPYLRPSPIHATVRSSKWRGRPLSSTPVFEDGNTLASGRREAAVAPAVVNTYVTIAPDSSLERSVLPSRNDVKATIVAAHYRLLADPSRSWRRRMSLSRSMPRWGYRAAGACGGARGALRDASRLHGHVVCAMRSSR